MADAPKTVYVDGTESTGHYLSLQAAITAQVAANANLVTAEIAPLNIEISITTAEPTAVTVNGFTTDATHYVNIYTTAAARHAGVYSGSKYRIAAAEATGGSGSLSIQDDYVRVDGLQIVGTEQTANSQSALGVTGQTATNNAIWISNCIIIGHGDATYSEQLIRIADTDTIAYIWNCVVYGASTNASSAGIYSGGATVNVYCCTIHSGAYGVWRGAGTLNCKNVYCSGTTGKTFNSVSADTNCAESVASTGTLTGANHLHSVAADLDTFVDPTNADLTLRDYHLAADDASPLQGADATWNLSGESAPLNFTTDIAGSTRDGTWDIGAFADVSATAQYARPAADRTDGNWLNASDSNTNLYASLDETTADDDDYIKSGAAPSQDTCTIDLSSIATPTAGTVNLRVRAKYL